MLLTDRVVLLTGAKRVGAAIATAVAARGADVALSYNRSQRGSRRDGGGDSQAGPPRADGPGRRLGRSGRVRGDGRGRRPRVRPARRARQHGVALQRGAVRRARRHGVGPAARRRSARVVSLRARGGAADAPARRRAHHQFLRLGRRRAAGRATRATCVLRREGGREGADRSAGARAGGAIRFWSTRSRPGRSSRRRTRRPTSTRRSRSRRRSAAGAARTRSRRPCSRSSTQTSSPARRSASTAAGT